MSIDAPFELHPRLAQDCVVLGRWPLSLVLLMNDRRYPWLILVPQRAGIREIHHLDAADQQQLWQESARLARAMEAMQQPDKLNIAAIGNLVPQLHVHHIARYQHDAVWPRPVWGEGQAQPYTSAELADLSARWQAALAPYSPWP